MTPKYYKNKQYGFIVELTKEISSNNFEGIVIVGCEEMSLLEQGFWSKDKFEPYRPTPQELASYPNTANLSDEIQKYDTTYPSYTQIRLECLKLATVGFNVKTDSVNLATSVASEFYDWVIGKK